MTRNRSIVNSDPRRGGRFPEDRFRQCLHWFAIVLPGIVARGGDEKWELGELRLLPLAGLLFFDSRPLVHQRHLALPQKGCRGHKVALGQPLRELVDGLWRKQDRV
jgi:hypothetical protein